MIESITEWLTIHADHAPLFVFSLLLITGFSFPISEDIVVIGTGVLAATVLPEKMVPLFLAVCIGAYLSDWIAYWIGRVLGPKLANMRLFRRTFSSERQATVQRFFQRYGFLTLFIGRLIPFGVRNTIFMAAGAGKMHFGRFMLSDGIATTLFSSTVFFLAYRCGEQYDRLHMFISSIGYVVGFGLIASGLAWYVWSRIAREEAGDRIT